MGNRERGLLTELKSRIDLVDYIGRYTALKKIGKSYLGLCPLHKEKSPSFRVTNDRYYCFGCHAKGDVIQFIQDYERITTGEAIRRLESMVGIKSEYVPYTVPWDGQKLVPKIKSSRGIRGTVELADGSLEDLYRTQSILIRDEISSHIGGVSTPEYIVNKLGSNLQVYNFVQRMTETDKEIYIREGMRQFPDGKDWITLNKLRRLKNENKLR